MPRFILKTDDPYVKLYAQATSELANRAGVTTPTITVNMISKLGLPKWMTEGIGGGYNNSAKNIMLNDEIMKPVRGEVFMHEYGHAIDATKFFGLKGKITPYIYPFRHYSTEVAANNEALKLLDQIKNKSDRELAKRLYNKGQAINLGLTKLYAPADYIAGGVGLSGQIGGGYLGYRAGKALGGGLYDAFNKPPKNEKEKQKQEQERAICETIVGATGVLPGAEIGLTTGRLGGMSLGKKLYIEPNKEWISKQRAKIPRLSTAENERFARILRKVIRK